MKISYSWLKKYINIDLPLQNISELLTDCGLEVEGLEMISSVKGGLEGVLVGLVEKKEKHPDADKLSLTSVRINNTDALDIVCGAPNVREGQKVLVATVGTKMYTSSGEFTINKTKIRGKDSSGMICSEEELGLGVSKDGIMVLPEDAPIGMSAAEYFKIEKDWVFEIGLTPNRSDAVSHMGVARDLLAVVKNRNIISAEKISNLSVSTGFSEKIKEASTELLVDVEVKDFDACPRYSGITMTNIKVEESPEWLKNKLKTIGLKPINNIVDISNYILFDLGQPLHIFDADKISDNKIVVQKYDSDFEFETLDGAIQKMSSEDLMICNAASPMCIAGIYGGVNSGVTNDTKNIFIESAYFSPVTIRKTSKRLGIKTDSSFRFERGCDPNMTLTALSHAVNMILDIAGGKIASPIIDKYPNVINPHEIKFSFCNFWKIAGKSIDKQMIKNILAALDIKIKNENEDELLVLVPTYRVDVTREIDLTEEILRIYGYNNIEVPEKLNASLSYRTKPDYEKQFNFLSEFLCNIGYNEIMNNSLSKIDYYEQMKYFDKEEGVKIVNPLSKDLEILRQTLLFSSLEVVSYNIKRSVFDLKLFELGKTYKKLNTKEGLNKYSEGYKFSMTVSGKQFNESWIKDDRNQDFFSLNSDLNELLKKAGLSVEQICVGDDVSEIFEFGLSYMYKKKPVASLGLVKRQILNHFDIKQDVFYTEIDCKMLFKAVENDGFVCREVSKFPKMRRDLALLIRNDITFGEIQKIALDQNYSNLKKIDLFDIYKGDGIEKGKKSYAVSYVFQDESKTLTDESVDTIMNNLIAVYKTKLDAIIR